VLKQHALEEEVVDKIKEQKVKKKGRKNQDGLNMHLPQRREQLKRMLRKK
jgi:uncharacterized protein (UPF0216 family)